MERPAAVIALEEQVKQRPLPAHVGIIMDGNGRWAEARGMPRVEGHREGSNSVREVTRCARRVGVNALTLYAFSSQNWSRPVQEVSALMELLREYLLKERDEIMENAIRLHAVGELDRLPRYVREPLDRLCAESKDNKGMVLSLALSYGGREEILSAATQIAAGAARQGAAWTTLKPADFEAHLWTRGLPPLDLIIRTSGEYRLSNFLLWGSAYAELIFTDVLWPDFRDAAFLQCVLEYQRRERRFGLTTAQVRKPAVTTTEGQG